MAELPSGTVTLLFTDIEGSTRMLRELGDAYAGVLEKHNRLLGEAVEQAGGQIFGSEGDALFAVFDRPAAALTAAVEGQRRLATADWPEAEAPRVRMGIHTGEVTRAGDDYVGLALHHVARLTAAGHGGQILLSEVTRQLTSDSLPEGGQLRDLGVHRLKDLARPERIHQLTVAGLPDEFPVLRTLGNRPNNLPSQLTSFVGRAELAEARRLLDATRLLTLTGPGGTGKTRMALQLAGDAADSFPDGVYFVALDTVGDPDLVPATIVAVLGLTDASGSTAPTERVFAYLQEREMLLVLDNLEQVIGAASFVGLLLRSAPRVKVLATSRIPLRVAGEQELAVPPLSLPGDDGTLSSAAAARSEAVRLFVERAMAVQSGFRLTDDNAGDISEIVRRVDGLPLAIELAAARIRILPLPALRRRLDQRLGVLVGGSRDLPGRQQTLRGAIDWSHDLLEESEKRLFASFAVFAGGAWLSQAEVVCAPDGQPGGDVLEGLASLVEKSLLRSVPTGDEPRFAMLAIIREYGLEKLEAAGQAERLRRRHAETYLELLETRAPLLTGGQSRELLDQLEPDHENLRTSVDWAIEKGEASMALRFIAAAWRYWQIRGHLHEAQERIDRALAMPTLDEAPAAVRARALVAAGGVAYWRGDYPAMSAHYRAALEHARQSGDRAVLAEALYSSGYAVPLGPAITDEDLKAAMRAFEESRQLYAELGDRAGIADATWAMAISAFTVRDYDAARRGMLEALEAYRPIDNRFGMGWSTYMLAASELLSGNTTAARSRMREAFDIFIGTGDKTGIALAIGAMGVLADRDGNSERAWRLFGAVEGLRRSAGVALAQAPTQPEDIRIPSEPPADDETASRAWSEGVDLDIDGALRLALDEAGGTP